MDIAERATALALKIRKHKAGIETEEATKNAFVMPFISTVLGYDVFNPSEVIPEFTADVGVKKGEKVDYAIVHGGQVQVLIEVKKINAPLCVEHSSQLYRYFSVVNARIAILTNGEVYEFYTDLEAPNKMDSKPYLVLDFSDIDDTLLPELAKLTKDSFDLDSVINAAEELKYVGQLRRVLTTLFRQPDDEWMRFLIARVYERSITQKVREQFAPLVDKAARQFLNEQANDRLKSALVGSDGEELGADADLDGEPQAAGQPSEPSVIVQSDGPHDEIVTTEDELEGFRIVRAIVCSEVAIARVVARDNKSYFSVLLDDNNRKPIARLWFNRSKKYLGVFDEHKLETRIPIDDVDGIYQHADHLRKTVAHYLAGPAAGEPVAPPAAIVD